MEDNPVTGIAMCIPQLEPKPIGCPVDRARFHRLAGLLLAGTESILFGDVVYNCEHYTCDRFWETFSDNLKEVNDFLIELNAHMEKCKQEISKAAGDTTPEAKEITLTSLCGLHKLSGVGRRGVASDSYAWRASVNQFLFTLDGVTYAATEDENDGYRSCMDKLEILDAKPVIMFDPVDVLCRMENGDNCDILEMIDIRNGKTVLRVGTDYPDSYYPCFVSEWIPENLYCNTGV